MMWHFLREDRRLGYEDGRLVEVGKTIKVDREPILCEQGLHASRRVIDALKYAPGPVICFVELGGKVVESDDKLVGQTRRVLWMFDCSEVLHRFTCQVAKEALDRVENPDKRSYAAIQAKLDWLDGRISDEELSTAELAAWSAAESTAELAAWSAAESAAVSAADSAARSAAWSAAWSVAQSAAWSVAQSAAQSAAWSAAYTAARSTQNELLESMIHEAKGEHDKKL